MKRTLLADESSSLPRVESSDKRINDGGNSGSTTKMEKEEMSSLCRSEEEKLEHANEDSMFCDCLYEGATGTGIGSQNTMMDEEMNTNNFVDQKILEIEKEVDRLSDQVKDAYFVALQQEVKQNTHYVRNRKFLLAFLRADQYDARKAATRVAHFFKFKLELFGAEKLPRRIVQADLNDDDYKVLASGFMHYDNTDFGGRSVCLSNRNRLQKFGLLNSKYVNSIRRVAFYQLMFAVEDSDQLQIKGAIGIRWTLNSALSLNDYRILFKALIDMYGYAIPIRWVAIHNCCSTATGRGCARWVEAISQRYSHHQYWIHGPSPAQCFSELSQYGIDMDALPLTPDGQFKEIIHKRYLENMCKKENELLMREVNSKLEYLHPNSTSPSLLARVGAEEEQIVQEQLSDDEVQYVKCQPAPPRANTTISSFQSEEVDMEGIKETGYSSNANRKLPRILIVTNNNRSVGGVSSSSSCRKTTLQSSSGHGGSGGNFAEEHLPMKMMEILNRGNNIGDFQNGHSTAAIWWSRDDGTAFAIDKSRFAKKILPTEFHGVKLDSFLRRMRRWGFQRLPKEKRKPGADSLSLHTQNIHTQSNNSVVEYQHHLFQRDSPDLLKHWDDIVTVKDVFPIRLMKLLSNNSSSNNNTNNNNDHDHDRTNNLISDSIWWVDNGKAFAIDKSKFSTHVFETHFSGLKFDSFCRTLRSWGFIRLKNHQEKDYCSMIGRKNNNVLMFYHPMFQKDVPLTSDIVLSSQWTRNNNNKNENNNSLLVKVNNKKPKESSSQLKLKQDNVFPRKLYKILRSGRFLHAIWWLDNHDAFAIDKSKFSNDVLRNNFKGIRFESFRRNLNRWGFKNVRSNNNNILVYKHRSFKKHYPELLNTWHEPNKSEQSCN